jgi:hypothetical protein
MNSNEKLKTQMYGLIARWEQSGLNQKAFCKSEGINYYKFKYWKTRQYQEQKYSHQEPLKLKPDFIPITVPGFENILPGVELTFPNGVKLSFKQGIEPSLIKELIKLY